MRIITGQHKGRTIRTVRDLSVRPATDRVRQTIFNMLAHRIPLEGAVVLDLFAGSGSLGLEALSRGAAAATFVESDRAAAEIIAENLHVFGAQGGHVIQEDAIVFLAQARGSYDIIFADPPYAFAHTEELPALVVGRKLLKAGGILLIEHARDRQFSDTPLYARGPEKRFGRTIVTFFQEMKP
jgi:16S rRNA (guanine966-N2)-methyltransferase